MEMTRKIVYEAPSATVYEVAQKGVICASNRTEAFRSSGHNYGDDAFE